MLALALISAAVLTAEAQDKPTVYVVNYPLQYFTQRIGGDHVSVVFPAHLTKTRPSGSRTWLPSPPSRLPI
jgi:hypothetical protein